jgi:membrane protease YdiL (CAAX protease family)
MIVCGDLHMQWLEHPAVKWAIPLPLLAMIAPLVWLFFRATWRELDAEALALRSDLAARQEIDYRPMVALTLAALILTLHEYYGRPDFYDRVLRPLLLRRTHAHPDGLVNLELYDELYVRIWWGLTRIGGYLAPLAIWPLFFRRDRLADFGLRTRGFLAHAWIYALCVAVMVPVLLVVSRQPDFADYYPMYKLAGRSWLDFAVWELVYVGQFFALEIFFRGFWLRAMRSFGAGAIWSMVVPYCMIHYGKPYLEACAAVVAGVVLGSLAMRTRSIYAGFLVHGTVAILMDVLALYRRHALPSALTPRSARHLTFPYWSSLIWIAWALALSVLAWKAWRKTARGRHLAAAAPGP